VYAECNAVSPDRTRAFQRIVEGGGAHYVDGGIIGGPSLDAGGEDAFYLGTAGQGSGGLLCGKSLQSSVICGSLGSIGLEVGFAAYTKVLRAPDGHFGDGGEGRGACRTRRSMGDAFTDQAVRRVCADTAKAWRFVVRCRRIAATFKAPGCLVASTRQQPTCSRGWRNQRPHRAPAIESVLKTLLRGD